MRPIDRELCVQDSALVSLLDGVAIEPTGLRDIDRRVHPTNAVGRVIATTIQSPVTVAQVVDTMVDRYGMDWASARRDLVVYLGDLDNCRLISIRQSFVVELGLRLRHALLSVAFAVILQFRREPLRFPTRRYRPSAGRVLSATLEAHRSTLVMGALLIVALTAVGVVRSTSLGGPLTNSVLLFSCAVLFCYVLGLIGSGALHELGHYAVAKLLNVPVLSVFARMGCSGLSHLDRSPASTAAVTAAGPLAGVAVPLGLMYASFSMGSAWLGPLQIDGANVAIAFCWAAVALTQVLSLTPFTGEGRRLARSLVRALVVRRAGRLPVAGGVAR